MHSLAGWSTAPRFRLKRHSCLEHPIGHGEDIETLDFTNVSIASYLGCIAEIPAHGDDG